MQSQPMNRRKFLRWGTTLAAGAPLAWRLGEDQLSGAEATQTTGAKSVSGLYGSLASRCGSTACVPWKPISTVRPFAGDFATWSAASTPLAPVLFSTMTVAPLCSLTFWAKTRERMSAMPPAWVGTITRIGWSGKFWARAGASASRTALAATANRSGAMPRTTRRMIGLITWRMSVLR